MHSSYIGLLLILLPLVQNMAISSPTPECKWDVIKNQTQKLNTYAMKFYNATQAKDGLHLDIPRIRCEHHCGPQNLSSNNKTCLQHIHHVLSSYQILLGIIEDRDIKNSEKSDIDIIKQIISKLLQELHCLGDRGEITVHHKFNVTSSFVKRRFGTPLASATTVIARVFAAGNPANHMK